MDLHLSGVYIYWRLDEYLLDEENKKDHLLIISWKSFGGPA